MTSRQRAGQWSRTAFSLALLFGSLPAASRLFLGVWGFDGAAGVSCLCLLMGTYFHIRSRRAAAVPDPATLLDQAIQLASSGRMDEAIARLTEATRLSPRLWQAFQYRGELHLAREAGAEAAVQDFDQAIRLAPDEADLYVLRGHAYQLLGDEPASQRDFEYAASLQAKQNAEAGRPAPGLN